MIKLKEIIYSLILETLTKSSADIVVGASSDDGVSSSNDVGLHRELNPNLFGKTATDRVGKHWRYNSETKRWRQKL